MLSYETPCQLLVRANHLHGFEGRRDGIRERNPQSGKIWRSHFCTRKSSSYESLVLEEYLGHLSLDVFLIPIFFP